MKLGIIGPARSGKTTFFNALTRRAGESASGGAHPVPVLGVVAVPDPRLDWLSQLYRPKKTTHAQVTYMDLQGAPSSTDHKHEYMSLLLTHMRPMDAFLLVLRNFPDDTCGPPRVERDFRELEEEFIIADLATVEKRLERIAVEHQKGRKIAGPEKELLEACLATLNAEKPLRSNPSLASAPELKGFTFLSSKPVLVIVNNADDDDREPEFSLGGVERMGIRAKLEMELAQLPEADARAFMQDFGLVESALDRVIARSYSLLQLSTFFTVGEDEVRAWTITRDLPALEAAGVVHTDMKKGFIRAEVVAYHDLQEAGDYAAARKHGMVRLEGKTYPVRDGDVIHFRFNV